MTLNVDPIQPRSYPIAILKLNFIFKIMFNILKELS